MLKGILLSTSLFFTLAHANGPRESCSLKENWQDNMDFYYVHYQRQGQGTERLHCHNVLAKMMLGPGNSREQYQDFMEALNVQGDERAVATIDLALYLQKVWENKFLLQFVERSYRKIEQREFFAYMALPLLGLLAVRNPLAAFSYFRRFRRIFPLVGGGAIALGGSALILAESSQKEIPLPPAHYLDFVPQHLDFYATDYQVNELIGDLLAMGAGGGAIYGFYRGVKIVGKANKILTPLKVAPLVLIVSVLVGFTVEYAAGKAIEYYDQKNRLKELNVAIISLDEVRNDQFSESEQMDRLNTFIHALHRFAVIYYGDVFKVFQDYHIQQRKLMTEFRDLQDKIAEEGHPKKREKLAQSLSKVQRELNGNHMKVAQSIREMTDGQSMVRISSFSPGEAARAIKRGEFPHDYAALLFLGSRYLESFESTILKSFSSSLGSLATQAQVMLFIASQKEGA